MHIGICYYFIFSILQKGKLVVSHIPTSEIFTNPLTKTLSIVCDIRQSSLAFSGLKVHRLSGRS